MPQAEGPPKRVSLVGADDLRKMQEEEGEELLRRGLGGVMAEPCLTCPPAHSSQAAAEEGTDASGRSSNLRA